MYIIQALKELYRVLKPGGYVEIVEVKDIKMIYVNSRKYGICSFVQL